MLLLLTVACTALAQPREATVLGKPLQHRPPAFKQMASDIKQALLEDYSVTHDLEPTPAEIKAVDQGMSQATGRPASPHPIHRQFTLGLIRNWKVGRALYAKYGGRVRLSAFGFHDPMDAWEQFLIQQERAGSFAIPDPTSRAAIWAVFQDKSGGDGTVSGAKAAAIYATPLWEQPMR